MRSPIMRFVCALSLALVVLPAGLATGAEPQAGQLEEFEQWVESFRQANQIPAISIAMAHGDFEWSKAFGYADLENETPTRVDSAYRLASVTKPMTAVAVLQLVEQGKIDLDAEIQKYVPYFPKKEWPVTIRQLLGHLGGISHYRNRERELHIKEQLTTRQAIDIFAEFDLVAEPGTRYSYTSYGYNLLGAAIESASGIPYGQYMRQHVWEPAGMTATRMDHPRELIPHRVRGYELVDGEVKNSEFVNISSRFAAGGTRSNVLDLVEFARAVRDETLLKQETINLMFTPLELADGSESNYGLGWGISTTGGRFEVSHSGGQNETSTLLVYLPAEDFVVGLASNLEGANLRAVSRKLMAGLLGATTVLRPYSSMPETRVLLAAMSDAFDRGLVDHERHGRAPEASRSELAGAMVEFDRLVKPDAAAPHVEPPGSDAAQLVGSYLVERLLEAAPDSKPQLRQDGAIPAFAALVELCRREDPARERPRFSEALEKRLSDISKEWADAVTDEVRAIEFTEDADLDQLEATLRRMGAYKEVYPAFDDELVELARLRFAQGDAQRGARFAQLAAVYLYTESALANLTWGAVLVVMGNTEEATAVIQKASELDPRGNGSPAAIRQIASDLAAIDQLRASIGLLEIGTGVYPDSAMLHTMLGDHLLLAERADDARAAYSRALEVDADFGRARRALEQLETSP